MAGEASRIRECEIEVRVRYAECDPAGYLHHAKYFEYLEMGRTELLRRNGFAYREMEAGGEFFVVARLECRFNKPIRYDDMVRLSTRIERTTRARIDHTYEIRRDNLCCFTARSTLACVTSDGQLMSLPPRFLLPPG